MSSSHINFVEPATEPLFTDSLGSAASELVAEGDWCDLSTYSHVQFFYPWVKPATDNVSLRIAFREGGSDMSGTYYGGDIYVRGEGANFVGGVLMDGTNFAEGAMGATGNGTTEGIFGLKLELSHDGQQAICRYYAYQIQHVPNRYFHTGCFNLATTTVPDGMNVFFSSGNITAGASVIARGYL